MVTASEDKLLSMKAERSAALVAIQIVKTQQTQKI
jgi:hypothetical protein